MKLRYQKTFRPLLTAFLVLTLVSGPALAKPYVCAKTCKQEENCEVCEVAYCEKRRHKDGTLKDGIVGRKTTTECDVEGGEEGEEGKALTAFKLKKAPDVRVEAVAIDKRRPAQTQTAVTGKKEPVAKPTVDGRFTTTTGNAQLTPVKSSRLILGRDSIDVPRRFANANAFAAFAEEHLKATVYRDSSGDVTAVGGRYEWSASDGAGTKTDGPDLPDRVARLLGGADGQLVVGNQLINFASDNTDTTAFSPFSTTREHCVNRHCIEGTSWLTSLVFYHSLGVRTKQTSGGTDFVNRPCCNSGELIREDGENSCRLRRAGAWTYDRELGRLVPTDTDPYEYVPAKSCRSETLRNELSARAALIDTHLADPATLATVGRNTREVEIGEWLVTLGLDLTGYSIDEIDGVCGVHASNRGEFVETAEGHTGRDNSLCP